MSNGNVTLSVWKLSNDVMASASHQWMDFGFRGQHLDVAENSRNRRNVKWDGWGRSHKDQISVKILSETIMEPKMECIGKFHAELTAG